MAAPSPDEPRQRRRRSRSRGRTGHGKTSLGGGKVRTGHRVHGMKSRPADDDKSEGGQSRQSRRRDKSRGRDKPRRAYDTPFDDKGRCHHHKNVQLASKKLGGGWKVLHSVCPKCMEDKFERTGGGSGGGAGGGGDDKSVRSRATAAAVDADGKYDRNGCCVVHTHIQVAKKKMVGGWKVIRPCPACEGEDVDADDYSVKSGRSVRSNSSRKSTRSTKSAKSSRGKPGKASKSGRYGAMPFDGDGYCCRHPNVQLAKKKKLGGFKIIHDVCPECADEDVPRRKGGGRSRSASRGRRSKSGTGRVFDDSGSSVGGGGKGGDDASTKRKKRIRVKNLRTEDEDGRRGRYSGYVDDDHRPNGNGVMRYEDGAEWEGVWSGGSKAHGKAKGGR